MIEKTNLGKDGPAVGRLGYGAMVLEGYYGESDDDAAVDTLLHAIDAGMMIDSADAYGGGHNESLISRALKLCTSVAFIATKFGIVFDENANALSVELDDAVLERINEIAEPGVARGATLL